MSGTGDKGADHSLRRDLQARAPSGVSGIVLIHHLALAADWAVAQEAGEYRRSTLGATLDEVGFIHASFTEQLAHTAARFYSTVTEPLVVLDIDPARLGCEVRVEAAAGGERFPHIQGPIPTDAVVAATPARMVEGRLITTGT